MCHPTTEPPTTQPSVHISEERRTEAFLARLNNTIQHRDCKQLYTKVGDQCMSVFFMGAVSESVPHILSPHLYLPPRIFLSPA